MCSIITVAPVLEAGFEEILWDDDDPDDDSSYTMPLSLCNPKKLGLTSGLSRLPVLFDFLGPLALAIMALTLKELLNLCF